MSSNCLAQIDDDDVADDVKKGGVARFFAYGIHGGSVSANLLLN